jgi:thiamine pyrophosphokinase
VHVTIEGLKYTLSDATLTNDRALGVSNEFSGAFSTVSVGRGTLLICWEKRNGLPEKRIDIKSV